MKYVWIVLDALGTYVDSSLSKEDKIRILLLFEKIKVGLNCDKILFSFNSSLDVTDLRNLIKDVLELASVANVDLEVGPVFADEVVLINGTIYDKEDLFCVNKANKIIWYLNRNIDLNVDTLVYIDDMMLVEGITLCKKLENSDINLYLAHANPSFTNMCEGIIVGKAKIYDGSKDKKFLLKSVEYFEEVTRRKKENEIVRNRVKD